MPSLHALPLYPLKSSAMLPLVKAIIDAREIVANTIELELPEDMLSPEAVASDVRSAESVNEPIWITAHDDQEVLGRAAEVFYKRYGDASLLYDYDEETKEAYATLVPAGDAENDEEPQESEYTEDQFRTALVLLHQAKGNPLQAAANVAQLAPVSSDPDDYMGVLAIFVEQFPWVYSGLVEAGILSGGNE
jgi:hypothetical protein